jgi:hypothetical protein
MFSVSGVPLLYSVLGDFLTGWYHPRLTITGTLLLLAYLGGLTLRAGVLARVMRGSSFNRTGEGLSGPPGQEIRRRGAP